eukprot:CAMPEP_0171100400 /NCGR_PEP_ID=MMETSP0766_2-20121228/52934_1 /TAXON_ID=439317 /ORGANISM="Gambierdiscus australes, Strain CAWD 149" /LENGTH=323 /DNA_ID=CAMNT_0011560221 /DNA_START=17 /DNA_END=988 /DNA_ORIENTATION=+
MAHSCSSNPQFGFRWFLLLSLTAGALGLLDKPRLDPGSLFKAAVSNLFGGLPRVHLIRIQKTGSTTFGEKIMKRFCGQDAKECRWFWHLDYSQAQKEGDNLKLITLLRDPVERTLSEFFFMRAKQGRGLVWQNQWDFRNSTWLNLVQGTADVDEALRIYLHDYPGSASRNRQALYLIGFKGRQQALGWPIDWDGRHSELLALAERHLEETVAFGFTDCFVTSVGAMARALGWDALKAMEMAGHIRARGQNKPSLRSVPAKIWLSTQLDENAAGPSEDWAVDRKWRDLVSENVVRQIEKLNSVDMELHEYASKRFRERFGETCT